MSDQPYDVVLNDGRGRGSRLRMSLILVTMAVSVGLALFALINLLGGFADTDDTLSKAGLAGCNRNNILRKEVNRQAEAFVHHNDATLRWALVVRKVLDRTSPRGEDAFQATNTLIQEYRQVRRQYFELPIVNCAQRATESPGTPSELIPIQPEPPDGP